MDDQIVRPKLLDYERPRLDDPLHKENPAPHGFGTNPNDGLPGPVSNVTFEDTEAPELTPERFVCMGGFFPSHVGETFRPPCEHYRRQLLPAHGKTHLVCIRYCTAVRGETGEYVDLGNSEILACEFRSPPDPASASKLDAFDAAVMRRQEERKAEEVPFNPLKALEEEA